MNINQEIQIKQPNHWIRFHAYNIDFVMKIGKGVISKVCIPKCEKRKAYMGNCPYCNYPSNKVCIICEEPHLQELWMDGWIVGNDDGFLDDDSYYAMLDTGIKVPVDKEIYYAFIDSFENGPIVDLKPYILTRG